MGIARGMTSLQEYVTQQFPHHDIDMLEPRDSSDLELTDNTVVSFVVGSRAGLDLLSSFRQSVPNSRVAAVTVKPTDPSVVPTGDEDGDGVVDLPVRRVAAYGVIGFVAVGVLGALIAAITTDSATSIAIAAVFAGIIGAIVGAIVGGSRLAGQRATSQPRTGARHHGRRRLPRRRRERRVVGAIGGACRQLRGSDRRSRWRVAKPWHGVSRFS